MALPAQIGAQIGPLQSRGLYVSYGLVTLDLTAADFAGLGIAEV
jgi:hypothetical protein